MKSIERHCDSTTRAAIATAVMVTAMLLACMSRSLAEEHGAVAEYMTAAYLDCYEAKKTSAILPTGQKLAFFDLGPRDGQPVVLIHGYTDSSRDWTPLTPQLLSMFRLIVVDLRGHGASSKPECCYTRFDFAYDIKLLLDDLRIERADIVGHSLGSLVAQAFAQLWPDATRHLILISSTGTNFGTADGGLAWLQPLAQLRDPIDPNSTFMREWWHESMRINPEHFVSRQRRDAAAIPAAIWRAIADQSIVGVDLAFMLPRIRAPTLLIWGEKDLLATADGRAALSSGIAGSQTRIFSSLGHDLFWENPQAVGAVMREFLLGKSAVTTPR